jgi:hypothetical protein
MKFQKVSREEWLKLNQEERDYLTLEFNKSVEKRKRIALFATRGIALFCVLVLIFIGYAQIEASRSYGQIKEKYGKDAYCYLCGVESLRKCECIYWTLGSKPKNITEYQLELGNYNTQVCKGMHMEQGNMPDKNFIPIVIDLNASK